MLMPREIAISKSSRQRKISPRAWPSLLQGLPLPRFEIKLCRGACSWFHQETGTSHKELRESLEEGRGEVVMTGEYPQWLDDSDGIVTAYVPDSDGIVRPGAY
jgi:hypothetical protein